MADREKVIRGLEVCIPLNEGENCPTECPYYRDVCFGYNQIMRDALTLLKEQGNQKNLILKVVWDVLHEGVSTDTIADQDWVYEQIRNRIEKTY